MYYFFSDPAYNGKAMLLEQELNKFYILYIFILPPMSRAIFDTHFFLLINARIVWACRLDGRNLRYHS
jgi:hypothetical protein